MKVLKFGGSSIGTAERIKNVVKIISNNENKIVVFSAIENITNILSDFIQQSKNKNWIISDQLIDIIKEKHLTIITDLFSSNNLKEIAIKKLNKSIKIISKYNLTNISKNEEKVILSQGEILSTLIIYLYLLEREIDAVLLQSPNFLRTGQFNEPDYTFIKSNLTSIIETHKGCKIFMTQGFICTNHENNIDNLGRGGSDYSATIIGNALNVESIEIWTDIDGLHNNDPRFVEDTQSISHLSYDEASELAYFGAKILHPSSINPAQSLNIPIIVKSTMNPEKPGTVISDFTIVKGLKAIAAKDGITTIKVKSGRMMQAYGFLKKIFEVFEIYQTPVDMLTTSEISVAMTIENSCYLNEIVRDLSLLGEIQIEKDQCIICIVGNFSKQNIYIQNIIDGLNTIPIKMISFGANRNNMTIVVDSANKTEALNLLNNFILKNESCTTI